ncbi:MAG: hypothetical protein IPL95_11470 [Saprospiraceae bacterium]|nr:hypothetical protein [Saprospiraceae bacterium]
MSSNGQPNSWNKIPYVQNSSNNGIPQSFTISYDAFTGKKLENGKTYYYSVVAYDYNNYEEFNTVENYGQRQQYFEGSRNIKVYAVSPQRGEKYLVEPIVTRLEGEGTGSNILQISSTVRESILKNTNDGKVAYNLSTSPLQLLIIDPEKCNGKQFQISIVDSTLNDTILSSATRWKLTDLTNNNSIIAKNRIAEFNEELLDSFGIILRVEQAIEPGEFVFSNSNNGFRGVKISYNSLPFNWYESIGDGFVNTNNGKINSPTLKFFNVENDPFIDPYLAYTKSNNLFYPFGLMNFRGYVVNNNNLPYFTTGWMLENTFGSISRAPISKLNNVDIVLTPDKSKWSRCVIVETANTFYTSKMNTNSSLSKYYLGLETKPNPDGKFPSQFDLRGDFSVGKNDQNGDGKPDPDGAVDANGKPLYGMGWFPGYAVDIETGKRLNIYFGENSCYSEKYDSICKKVNQIGGDMLWNPNGNLFTGDTLPNGSAYSYFAGGQHFIYVTNQTYDSCETIRKTFLINNKSIKAMQLKKNTWTSIPMPLKALKPLGAGSKGLIPSECVIKLRVDNAYQVKYEKGINNGYPTYLIDFKNSPIEADNFKTEFVSNNLSNVLIHPNPYFPSKHSTLNMNNLPENSQIEIYNLSGNLLLSQQISKQFSWDHKLQNGNLLNTTILLIKITNLDDKSYEIKKVMVE